MNAPAQPRTLQDVAQQPNRDANLPAVQMGFANSQSFELMQRAAKMLTHSTLVPVAYRARTELKEYGKVTGYEDNPSGLSNCVVALNMAQRMGADPLMVMQNLYIVEGRPSWSSQFIIAAINSCGKYSPLRFDLSKATEPQEVTYNTTEWQDPPNGGKAKKVTVQKKVTVRHQTCVAWAIEKETGARLESPTISIQMAIDEGWLTKNGSKWMTMPEVMLRYRSAAFFGKLYAPELLMGLQTAEEAQDIIDLEPQADGKLAVDVESLRAASMSPAARRAESDATDVQATDVGSHAPTQATQAAEAEQQPAQQQQTDADAQSTAAPTAAGAESSGPLSESQIAARLNAANNSDELTAAIALIADVPDPDAEERLSALATTLRQKFDRAGRRTRSAAPNVE
jgi:hypothetical protein